MNIMNEEVNVNIRSELIGRFRDDNQISNYKLYLEPEKKLRTVGELRSLAEKHEEKRLCLEAMKREKKEQQRKCEAEKVRQKYLEKLSTQEEKTWNSIESLIMTKRPKQYTEAISLLNDLYDLAKSQSKIDKFSQRYYNLRQQHNKKTALLERMDKKIILP
jgi:hypothetical protein